MWLGWQLSRPGWTNKFSLLCTPSYVSLTIVFASALVILFKWCRWCRDGFRSKVFCILWVGLFPRARHLLRELMDVLHARCVDQGTGRWLVDKEVFLAHFYEWKTRHVPISSCSRNDFY